MRLRGRKLRGRLEWLAAAMLLLSASPIAAEPLPRPEEIATPEERPILAEVMAVVASPPDAEGGGLATLDRLLPRLTRPTRLRGMVQYLRGVLLLGAEQPDQARTALEESIRLLPGFSAPLLVASSLETNSDRADVAIDYLLRASAIDPDTVRRMPDFDVRSLVNRVQQNRDARQLRKLAARLLEINWEGQNLSLRSSLAAEAIKGKVQDGDLEAARALLQHLASPMDVRELLIEDSYRELWPALEEWSGPRQERLWPLYLTELRERWRASQDFEQGLPYLNALSTANRYQAIIAEFLPLFSPPLDWEGHYHLLWIASPLATALARVGRWDEAEEVFTKALEVWPVGEDPNALNLLANRGRLRYLRGDFGGAVADLQASLINAESSGGMVSANAANMMHRFLACSLHELGRDGDAARSTAAVLASGDVTAIANLHLCFGRHDAARSALIEGLAIEAQRDDIIGFVQLENAPPLPSDHDRRIRERANALRADPLLLREVERFGRILPYPAGAGASPSEAEQERPVRI